MSGATRTFIGDVLDERAHALMDAVSLARETLCIALDGPQEQYQEAVDRYQEDVADVMAKWQALTPVMASAQWEIERGE